MIRLIFLIPVFLVLGIAAGQSQSGGAYSVALIPGPLQAYASAVVRQQESTVEVKDLSHVVYRFREAITILNNSGNDYGHIRIYYDKARQIKSVRATVYDASGKVLKKVSASDFQDNSDVSDISLFDDNRIRHYTPTVGQLPYTIEYEYELRIRHTFFFPRWLPQRAPDIAVENSTYRFTAPDTYPVRLYEHRVPVPKKERPEGTLQVIEWSAKELAAYKPEPYSPPLDNYLTMVDIAPVQFSYEGIAGQYSDWQEYGKWIYDHLLKGRDYLPPATVAQVNQLVAGIDSPREKAKKIYEYVQNKCRYISVQIGIGSLQPMKAEAVDQLSYGDCKALTNYTAALLKAAGVPSLYAEVYGGYRKKSYLPGFASPVQGNHVILCLPLEKDTVWLECTSRDAPFGFLGSFTDDRYALLCTEKGGIIARTRTYAALENRQTRTAAFQIDGEGNLSGFMETRFEGNQYDNRNHIHDKSAKERVDALKRIYAINDLDIMGYALEQKKQENPLTTEKIEVRASKYGTLNGNTLFIPLNAVNHIGEAPKDVRNRKNPVYIARGFCDEDVLEFTLPAGYQLDYVPPPVELTSEFGTYLAKIRIENNKLIYSRKLILQSGEHAPDTYESLIRFFKRIHNADNAKLVLVKQ